MIKENQNFLNRMHVVLDAFVIVIAYVLSWYLRFRSGIFEMDPWYLSLQVYMSVLIFIVPGYLLLYYIFQLYTPKRVKGRRLEAWNILQANTIGFLVFILALFQASDRFLQNDDIHLLLYEYFPGSTRTQSDQNGTSQDPESGI